MPHGARFDMVGMVATLAILGFHSIGIISVITARFIISVAILAILAWGIVMVLAIILMMPLIRLITVLVFVLSVLMVDMVRGFVLVPMTRFLGLDPLYKELLLEIRYGVGQRILRAKQTSVGGDIAGHVLSAGCRPLDLDGL